MLAAYGALLASNVPIVPLLGGFGLVTAATMTGLHVREQR